MVGNTIGDINYLSTTTDGCPPYLVTYSMATTMRSNISPIPVYIPIQDLRGKEKSVNLDTNALEIFKYNGSIQKEFEIGSEAQQIYYEEIKNLLKKHLGASDVIIYNHSFRSRGSPRPDDQCDDSHRNPAFYPHVDIDPVGVEKLVTKEFGEQADEKIKRNRIQVVNIWRPIGPHPIVDKPLAICDYRSIDVEKDIHALAIRGVVEHATAYTISRNAQDAHIWYYLSEMRSDEMFVFKMYDSKPDVAQFAAHTAFHNGNGSVSNEEQKSLEVRCLIVYND